jgi:cytochrome P450
VRVGNNPLLPFWKPIVEKSGLVKLVFPKVFSDRIIFGSFVHKVMSERVEKSKSEKVSRLTERKDIFYWLTNSKGPDGNPGYSMPELFHEARTLVTAGSDTSAITLAAVFFYLCRNLDVLANLQKELRSTFGTFDEIRAGQKRNNCTFLRAVIDETLRITPPVPSSIPREVQLGGITINNQYFPKGVILGTSASCPSITTPKTSPTLLHTDRSDGS